MSLKSLPLALALAFLPAAAQTPETWVVKVDLWGNPLYQLLTVRQDKDQLQGDLDGDAVRGQRLGATVAFTATDSNKGAYVYAGKVDQGLMRGTADFPDSNHPERRLSHAFTARRLPERPAGGPHRYEFTPTDYSNSFNPHREPVLTIWPGDTVHTKTIDSGGVDEHGVTTALFGNPQTGPFFIATANAGDTLVIHLKRLRLNRDYADSLDDIVGRAQGQRLAAKSGDLGKPVRWRLDLQRGVTSPETPSERLKGLAIPVRPMLGGLSVAPGFGSAPLSTGDTGRHGGNMDFNEVVEGNTIYLPVQQPGALLYLGDAHALQGDGETSQYALETSMDVEFTVDVIKDKAIGMPCVESPTQIMALGQAGSLDEALRAATTGLTQWLQRDYALTLSECAQLLGSSVHYTVANLAGRSVGVAAKLDKAWLVPPRTK
ncbi:acetamidase/formamidase family protein [Geothrix sp. PMB-07]|uniref:acetamidase/formamidase family protein n=1 Tax=Geothrix sp. PMB-07 TaxID=3068640 RepID=UPI002742504D|nr:acetamidase/formamidase family protein [Geothrix sp. PMB-07]WLT31373.1 acetamidase/formamidase family protein [Geothrix sp. PMB-07]